jgi:hypothetical protein
MDLITVAEFSASPEATLAKNLLADEGIEAVLSEEYTGDLFELASNMGSVKLQVRSDDAERARALLDSVKHDHTDDEEEDEDEGEGDDEPPVA